MSFTKPFLTGILGTSLSGKPIHEVTTTLKDTIVEINYFYEKDGNIKEEINYFGSKSTNIYHYNSNDKIIKQEKYFGNKKSEENLNEIITFIYDKEGNISDERLELLMENQIINYIYETK